MTETITANVFITKSLTAIDKLFLAEHRLDKYKESLGTLSEEEFNQSFIASPMNNDGLMYFEYNFQVNGNADQGKGVSVVMRLTETSKLLEMFLLENDPLERILSEKQEKLKEQSKAPKNSIIASNPFDEVNFEQKLKRSSRYYMAFGTSDNVKDWSGPYSMQLAGATLSNDSNNVRSIEVTFVPQIESFKSYSPKLGTLLGYNDNLQNLSQFVIDDQKQVCSSKSIKEECINKTFNLDVEIRELLKDYISNFTNNSNNVVLAFPQKFGDISLEAGPIQSRQSTNFNPKDPGRTTPGSSLSTVKTKGHGFKIRESVFKDIEDFKRTGINVSILENYGGPKSEQAQRDYLEQQGLLNKNLNQVRNEKASLKQRAALYRNLTTKIAQQEDNAVAERLPGLLRKVRKAYVEEKTIARDGDKLKIQNDAQKKLDRIEAEANEFSESLLTTPDATLNGQRPDLDIDFVVRFSGSGFAELNRGFDPSTLSQGLQTPGITPSQRAAYIIFYDLGIRTMMTEANKNNQDLKNAVVNAETERQNKRVDAAYENDVKPGGSAEKEWFDENAHRIERDLRMERVGPVKTLSTASFPVSQGELTTSGLTDQEIANRFDVGGTIHKAQLRGENPIDAVVDSALKRESNVNKKIDFLFKQNVAAKWELVSESKRALAKILEDELGFKLSIDQSNGTPQNVYNGFSPLVSPLIKFASEIKDRGDGNIKTSYLDFYEETDMRILSLWAEHGIISNPDQPAYVFGDMHEIAKTLYLEDGEPQEQTINTLFGYDDLVAGNEGIPYEVQGSKTIANFSYHRSGRRLELL